MEILVAKWRSGGGTSRSDVHVWDPEGGPEIRRVV